MPRTNDEQLAARAWASKPRVLPGPCIPWPKTEPKPPQAVAPVARVKRKAYAPHQVRRQLDLFNWLHRAKAHQGKLGYERKELPERFQPAVEQLVSLGVLERRYDRFKSYTGKQKICYLALLTKTDLPESYFRTLVTLSEGPA